MSVTNQSDKDIQLPKLLTFNDEVRVLFRSSQSLMVEPIDA